MLKFFFQEFFQLKRLGGSLTSWNVKHSVVAFIEVFSKSSLVTFKAVHCIGTVRKHQKITQQPILKLAAGVKPLRLPICHSLSFIHTFIFHLHHPHCVFGGFLDGEHSHFISTFISSPYDLLYSQTTQRCSLARILSTVPL